MRNKRFRRSAAHSAGTFCMSLHPISPALPECFPKRGILRTHRKCSINIHCFYRNKVLKCRLYRRRFIVAVCAEHGRFVTSTYSCECVSPERLYIKFKYALTCLCEASIMQSMTKFFWTPLQSAGDLILEGDESPCAKTACYCLPPIDVGVSIKGKMNFVCTLQKEKYIWLELEHERIF